MFLKNYDNSRVFVYCLQCHLVFVIWIWHLCLTLENSYLNWIFRLLKRIFFYNRVNGISILHIHKHILEITPLTVNYWKKIVNSLDTTLSTNEAYSKCHKNSLVSKIFENLVWDHTIASVYIGSDRNSGFPGIHWSVHETHK